jgi:mannose-6-phosphate isomerase-like protein (cupin superfamily)
MQNWLIELQQAREKLEAGDSPFTCFMRHGTMSVELYRPRGKDYQTPHKQDELYHVISGSGTFSKAGFVRDFKAGDTIFVEAGLEHRFESFSEDFETLVIFWGVQGGEQPE